MLAVITFQQYKSIKLDDIRDVLILDSISVYTADESLTHRYEQIS